MITAAVLKTAGARRVFRARVPANGRQRPTAPHWVSIKWPLPLWRLRGWAELPIGSQRFRFHGLGPAHHVWALNAHEGDYEPEVAALLERELRPGDTFLDIGAHLGAFAMLASRKVGSQGRVHAVEPDPRAGRLLQTNIRGNDLPVEVDNTAISDYDGKARLSGGAGDGTSSLSNTGLPVTCRTLDSLVLDLGLKPDVVKIDVEGAEGAVVRGGLDTLKGARLVVIEVHHRKIRGDHGDDPEAVMDLLRTLGPLEVLDEREQGRNVNYAIRPGAVPPGEGERRQERSRISP